MDLTDEQKQQVAAWVNAGESLAEIQRRLDKDFGLAMTYMDVRFLVDDLNLDLPAPEPAAEETAKPAADAAAELVDEGVPGGVQVEIDTVTRPGSMVSGSVTFSDGEKLGWQLDQMGRLGLIPGKTEGYRPTEDDIMAFQTQLEAMLQQKGF